MKRNSRGGNQRAVLAGMDRSMHQSGVRRSRPLAAGIRLRGGALQQLQLSASQRAASARPAHADAPALAWELSSTGPLAKPSEVTTASILRASSPRSLRGEPSPQFLQSKNPHPY